MFISLSAKRHKKSDSFYCVRIFYQCIDERVGDPRSPLQIGLLSLFLCTGFYRCETPHKSSRKPEVWWWCNRTYVEKRLYQIAKNCRWYCTACPAVFVFHKACYELAHFYYSHNKEYYCKCENDESSWLQKVDILIIRAVYYSCLLYTSPSPRDCS